MNNLYQHIQYLLLHHDWVMLPGIGAFIARYAEAKITDGSSFVPPSRSLGFNGASVDDDGLLISSVARREGISYARAKEIVKNEIDLMLARISTEGRVEIPRLGTLSRAESSAFIFEPAADALIVTAPFASLPVIALPQAEAAGSVAEPRLLPAPEADTPSHDAVFSDYERSLNRRRRMRTVTRYAASVALLLGIGFTLSTPVLFDDSQVTKASLSTAISSPASSMDAVTVTPVTPEATQPEPIVAEPAARKPDVMEVAGLTDEQASEYSCYVIVASCGSSREAERFISRSREPESLKILKSDGRYRVYAAVSNDYDLAYAYKSTSAFAGRYPQAWVYRSK